MKMRTIQMLRHIRQVLVLWAMSCVFGSWGTGYEHFDRDILPLLTANCVQCHGPDEEARKADLRLDQEESVKNVLTEILERITTTNSNDVMPPPKSGKKLTDHQKKALRDWIDSGAPWSEHWSTRPLQRPELPEGLDVQDQEWTSNPIDLFVLTEMKRHGLKPSAPASARTLIRRMSFDLLGLPPTLGEIEKFEKDFVNDEERAVQSLADRLLNSVHYGERWGRHWLDVARYADTCGYDKDKLRPNAWPYRDYVIRSFNQDKPYAQFVQEQIAGDALFPDSADGILGLGFIAAGPWDFIGHVEIPESKIDGRIARHIDRDEMVTSVMNTFTSATIQCAQCHNHKFDPMTQEHYYGMQSIFAAIDRADRLYDANPDVLGKRHELESEISNYKNQLQLLESEIIQAGGEKLASLEKSIRDLEPATALKSRPDQYGFHSDIVTQPDEARWVQIDLGQDWKLSHLILYPCHDDYAGIGAGFGFPRQFVIECSMDESFADRVMVVDERERDVPNPGLSPVKYALPDTRARFIRMTATRLAERQGDYIFALAELEIFNDDGVHISRSASVSASQSTEAPVRWARTNLTDGLFPEAQDPTASATLLGLKSGKSELLKSLRSPDWQSRMSRVQARLQSAQHQLTQLPPGSMVYAAATHFDPQGGFQPTKGTPREVHVLHRGNILDPKEKAFPGVIPIFSGESPRLDLPDPHSESDRRMALAQWITRPDHPLTWRSIVNRIWLWHFGEGIVSTPNDFGRMGQPPSHPQLLDWLATEFRDHDGRFKHLHKLIVTSAAYRQSSESNPGFEAKDADNRYLRRMNRRRLTAEELRDSILLASGALDRRVGGPGFYLFKLEKTDHSPHFEYHLFDPADSSSHRRSVYRFIVRSQPDPFMTTLDCADSSISTPKRNETLTALQALSLLNNPFTLVMADKFATNLLSHGNPDPEFLVDQAFQRVTGRSPQAGEFDMMLEYLSQHGLPNLCRSLFNLSELSFID